MNPPYQLIGLYLVADGLISYAYFTSTATPAEQVFRLIRVALGLWLLLRGEAPASPRRRR